jgi:NAD-dependent DNA ligase
MSGLSKKQIEQLAQLEEAKKLKHLHHLLEEKYAELEAKECESSDVLRALQNKLIKDQIASKMKEIEKKLQVSQAAEDKVELERLLLSMGVDPSIYFSAMSSFFTK